MFKMRRAMGVRIEVITVMRRERDASVKDARDEMRMLCYARARARNMAEDAVTLCAFVERAAI